MLPRVELPQGLLIGFAVLAALAGGAGAALAWATLRADRKPKETLEAALARLELERQKDRLELAKFIAESEEIASITKRHRARIDGAAARESKQQQPELEEERPPASSLSEITRRARARGLM